MANQYFTEFSQYAFLVQFLITLVVTIYLYFKYKSDWYTFEKYFFSFFVLITASNLLAIFYITDTGIPYALVVILSNFALVILLMAGETLMGVENKLLLYVLPILLFLYDSTLQFLFYNGFGIDEKIFRALTGINILLFTLPSLIIYIYLTYKTNDISIAFFVLALILYIAGGFTLTSLGEKGMAGFYIAAVVCFAIATVLPIIRNRLQSMSAASSATT